MSVIRGGDLVDDDDDSGGYYRVRVRAAFTRNFRGLWFTQARGG